MGFLGYPCFNRTFFFARDCVGFSLMSLSLVLAYEIPKLYESSFGLPLPFCMLSFFTLARISLKGLDVVSQPLSRFSVVCRTLDSQRRKHCSLLHKLTHAILFGQRPRRGRSPVEHRGTFVRPSVRSSVRPSVRQSPPGPLPFSQNQSTHSRTLKHHP